MNVTFEPFTDDTLPDHVIDIMVELTRQASDIHGATAMMTGRNTDGDVVVKIGVLIDAIDDNVIDYVIGWYLDMEADNPEPVFAKLVAA
jgi:hypothetical protein